MTTFKTAGTAIYDGNIKIAQCIDKDCAELFSEAILPREEWRELLPDYEGATKNADLLAYRANRYHEMRAELDRLHAACAGLDRPETQIPAPRKLATECIKLRAMNTVLVSALIDARNGYQRLFDVMPVAWQTYAEIIDAAIVDNSEGAK